MRLVIFDLDGTLTRHDTLGAYVVGFHSRRPWRLWRAVGALPALIAFVFGRADRGALKGALIHATLGGHKRSELEAHTERFVTRLLARGMHTDALAALAAHRAEGDVLVLLSASTDLYVPAIGTRLGFTQVICTGVRWRGAYLDGELVTANRRGAEKTRCLAQLRAQFPGLPTVAYADSASDLDHLAQVDSPALVNGSLGTRRRAAQLGITTLRWR